MKQFLEQEHGAAWLVVSLFCYSLTMAVLTHLILLPIAFFAIGVIIVLAVIAFWRGLAKYHVRLLTRLAERGLSLGDEITESFEFSDCSRPKIYFLEEEKNDE